MKPLSARTLCQVVAGDYVSGPNTVILYGAYRLKQVKQPHTVLFLEKRIMNWAALTPFFPLVLVTEWRYRQQEVPKQVTVIHVAGWKAALWQFIYYYRAQFTLPVVAITGTAGKTTTKEMVKHIVAPSKQLVATQLTANSRTALLQYLLMINEQTEVAVFETAVGAPGDVERAGHYFQPTIGVITNIGAHHLNYCQSVDGYIAAKGELLHVVQRDGAIVIKDEDAHTKKLAWTRFHGRIIRVGKAAHCDMYIKTCRYVKGGMHFTVQHQQRVYSSFVPGYGEQQVYNALMAAAVAVEIGFSFEQAIAALTTYKPLNRQLQYRNGLHGSILLDDTWSITTTSLSAALEVCNALAQGRRRIVVIGTITDVGSWGNVVHEQAATSIFEQGADIVVTIGKHAQVIADRLQQLQFTGEVHRFNNDVLAYELLRQRIDAETIVLIKGDMYSETMQRLAQKLRAKKESS